MNRREAKRIVCHAVARDLGIWVEEGLGGLLNDVMPASMPMNPGDDERLVDAALELAGELTRRAGAGAPARELEGQTTVDDFLGDNDGPPMRPMETIRTDKV